MIDARFGHVNVIARDWQRLADFYKEVFGMEVVPPLRDYRGPDLEAGTGIPGAALRGAHVRLPGLGAEGPTLEIYQYESGPEGITPAVNRPGFQHIAFVGARRPGRSRGRFRRRRRRGRCGRHANDRRRPARDLDLRHGPGGEHPRAPVLVGAGHRMTMPLPPGSRPAARAVRSWRVLRGRRSRRPMPIDRSAVRFARVSDTRRIR